MEDNIIPYLGHLAYTLIFFSFLVRRILWLRILAIVAGVASITYNYNISGEPLWIPIKWNVLFITTNVIHIGLILRDKASVKFHGRIKEIYQERFQNFSPMEFKKLLDLAYTRSEPRNKILIKENKNLGAMFLILEGKCSVQASGVELAELGKGDFVGEMSYLTDSASTADVVTKTQIRYLYWDTEKLTKFLSSSASLLHRFEGAIGKQLIGHIMAENQSKREKQKANLKLAS
jgi:hypothetical protein